MKRNVILVGSLLGTATTITYLLFSPSPPMHDVATKATPSTPLPSIKQPNPATNTEVQTPALLRVPSLKIEAVIEEVGLTPEGNMAAPTSNTTLGWYKYGALPGNPGSAVLAAHTGLPTQPTMFRQFETLKSGDLIEVEDTKGLRVLFTIIGRGIYTPETAPRQNIFGETTVARLAIITCTGTWISERKTYSHRLVIYTTRSS